MINKLKIVMVVAWLLAVLHFYIQNVHETHSAHIQRLENQIFTLATRNEELVSVREELVRQETFKRQLECLAMNIYHEARSESYDGRLAVATVTMNRVNHEKFPSTVCGVVWQARGKSCQFSWTCDGKSDRIRNQEAYAESVEMAENVLLNGLRSYKIDREVYHYHAEYVNPDWETKYDAELIAQVDTHKFYRIAYYAN